MRRVNWPDLGLLAVLAGAVLALALTTGASQGDADITIDTSRRFQVMSGWEATGDIPDDLTKPRWAAYENQMLDRVVSEVGINRIRLEIASGAENASGIIGQFARGEVAYDDWKGTRYLMDNDNDDPFVLNPAGFDFAVFDWHVEHSVLPMAKRLAARGEKLVINLNYVSFRDGHYFQLEPEEYAEFILATYQHLQAKYGLVPDMLEVILEPDNSTGAWDGEIMGRAMVATAKRLQDNGFTPAFVVPSVKNMDRAVPFIDGIARIPGALDHVVELSYHRYGGVGLPALRGIAKRASELGIRTGMTELWFGKADYRVLLQDLTVGNVSTFQGRVLQGFFDVSKGTTPVLTPRAEIPAVSLIYRAVRLGAQRVGAVASLRGVEPVAFVNTDGKLVVAVGTTSAATLRLHGLAPGRYGVAYQLARKGGSLPDAMVDASGDLALEMPGAGLMVVSGR